MISLSVKKDTREQLFLIIASNKIENETIFTCIFRYIIGRLSLRFTRPRYLMKEMLIFKPLLKSFFDLTFSILQYQFIFQEQQLLLCLRCKIENYQTNKKSKIRIILYRMKKKNILLLQQFHFFGN